MAALIRTQRTFSPKSSPLYQPPFYWQPTTEGLHFIEFSLNLVTVYQIGRKKKLHALCLTKGRILRIRNMTPERLEIAATVHMDIHLMESFAHVAQCENLNCQRKCCCHLMQVATHAKSCAIVKAENRYKCHLCRQVLALCAIHLENCRNSKCFIPFCSRYKKCKIISNEQQRCQSICIGSQFEIRVGFSKEEVINFNKFRKFVYKRYKSIREKYPVHKNRECEKTKEA